MSNLKQNEKKKIIILVIILIISLLAIYLIAYHQFLVANKEYHQTISDEKMKEINSEYKIKDGTVLEKTFTASKSHLRKIRISFSEDKDILTTTINVNIKLEDLSNNEIVKEENLSYDMLQNDNDYDFVFDTQKESKEKEYKLTIAFNEIGNSNLSILYSENDLQTENKIKVNGEEVKGTFAINKYYTASSRILKFNIISLLLSFLIIGLSIIIYTRKNLKPEKLFLYTVPIICLIFLAVMPMYRGHDENRHVLRIYEISDGNLLTEINGEKVGTSMPKSVIDGVGKYWREKLTYNDWIKLKDKKLEKENTAIPNMETVAVYSPVQYIPQALGMGLAKCITDNLLIILYVTRLFNLIACILLLYYAIKIIPFGKMLIYIIALLPLSIEAFSTMSPDGITISIAMLLVAYVLRIIYDKERKVGKKDVIILSILSIIIALCKIVYVPLVGIILLIPANKYKSKKQRIIVPTLIILVSIVINLIWFKISSSYLAITSDGSSTEKIKNVLMGPISYLKMLLYTMNYSGNGYIQSLFGSVLAMGEFVKLYFIVPFTYFVLFIFEAITNKELKNKFSKFQNIVMCLITIMIIGLVFTSLYVQFTDDNSTVIKGVQGRYFIPIMLIVGLLLSNLKIINEYKEENKIKLIGIVALILQLYIMLSIIIVHI